MVAVTMAVTVMMLVVLTVEVREAAVVNVVVAVAVMVEVAVVVMAGVSVAMTVTVATVVIRPRAPIPVKIISLVKATLERGVDIHGSVEVESERTKLVSLEVLYRGAEKAKQGVGYEKLTQHQHYSQVQGPESIPRVESHPQFHAVGEPCKSLVG